MFLVDGLAMSIAAKIVAAGLLVLALISAFWKVWHSADQAGYERAQIECQKAADAQREANRQAAHESEKKESVRVVYRDRVITKIVKEARDATAPLASCPVPDGAIRMLNDAAQRAREDRPAPDSADYSLSHPG